MVVVARGVSLLACVLGVAVARAGETRWTGAVGDWNWGTPANWQGATVPEAGTTAVFDGAGVGVVQLGGVTRSADALVFADGGAPGAYTVAGGTLAVASVTNRRPAGTFVGADLSGTALALTSDVGTLDLSGNLTSTALSVAGAGNVMPRGSNAPGTITVVDGAGVTGYEAASFGAAPITLGEGAAVTARTSSPAGAVFGNDITVAGGSTTVAGISTGGSGAVRFGALRAGSSFVDYETNATVSFSGAQLSGGVTFSTGGDAAAVLELGPVAEVAGSGASLGLAGANVRLTGAGSYTGGASVYGGSVLDVRHPAALGSGAVGVFRDGVLQLTTALSPAPAGGIGVYSFGVLAGDATGLKYSGAGRNVVLGDDAILAITAGPTPVRGVDVANAAYWLGISSSTQVANVGSDAFTSIYKGVALGRLLGNVAFAGAVNERTAGQGIEVYTDGTPVTLGAGATFNTTNAATGVHVFGTGEVTVAGPLGGTAPAFTFTGAGDASTQASRLLRLASPGAVPAGKRVDVSNGIVTVGAASAVGGTLNLKSGATLLLSDAAGTTSPTTGSYVVQSGGAVILGGVGEHLGAGATFTFQPGSLLGLVSDTNTSAGVGWTTAGADVVVQSPSVNVAGPGLVLSNGRRLTTGAANDASVSGGTISAAGSASVVLLSAGTGQQLKVFNDVSAANATVQIGSKIAFTTLDQTVRASTGQDGTVRLYGGNVSAATLDVEAGQLVVGDAPGDRLTAGSLVIASGASLDLATGSLGLANTPASTIRSYLLSRQLFSSSGDATRALGYIPGLLVKQTLKGDANLDGTIDADDYALLDKGLATNASVWWLGDFNYDGVVNAADYLAIDSTYLALHPHAAAALLPERNAEFGAAYVSALIASIPEPALALSAILYPLSSLLLIRRRFTRPRSRRESRT